MTSDRADRMALLRRRATQREPLRCVLAALGTISACVQGGAITDRAPAALASPSPPGIEPPRALACSLRADTWSPRAGALRLRAGGPPFAEVVAGRSVELRVAAGVPRPGAWVSVDVGGVLIQGALDGGDVEVFARRPFAVGGAFVPLPWTPIAVLGGRPGALEVAARLGHVKAPAERMRGERPCADLSPAMGWYDPLAAIPGASVLGTAALIPGSTVRLAPGPGDARTIEIAAVAQGAEVVDVLASAGDEREIAYHGDAMLVVGWLPAAELAPAPVVARDWAPDAPPRGIGKRRLGGVVHCGDDIELLADVAGERRTVGVVRAGTPIDVGTTRDGHAEVELPSATLTTAPGAALLVLRAALAACSPGARAPRAPTGP